MDKKPVGVPLQEGMELLGLDKSGFYYYVNKKKIKSYTDQSPALYDYQDIMVIREQRLQRLQRQKAKKMPIEIPLKTSRVYRVLPEDMVDLAPVIEQIFDTRPDIERWSSWIRKNPDVGYMVKSEGKIVGCGFILPLTEEKILDILSKEITPPTLADDILEYKPEVPVYLYARTIGVLQNEAISIRQRRHWASVLVRHIADVVIDLGARGIVIEKIYGRSDSEEGAHLMAGMGFTQIRTVTSHKNFLIDVKSSGLEMVLRYEQALNEWRHRHGGE
ncbi:MAG TPA: hypothetical protein VEL31_02710 [Ktedonobacteraceae bacterium]|nr:hypothetical protein [Ktedonobacteraceae bacterium]